MSKQFLYCLLQEKKRIEESKILKALCK